MPAGRLLIVAPGTDIRRSLVFALETEGYSVVARAEPPPLLWLSQNRFDCTIADQKAFTGAAYENVAFCIKAHPVVLLAAKPHSWLREWVVSTVDLPLAGHAVTIAVTDAMQLDP